MDTVSTLDEAVSGRLAAFKYNVIKYKALHSLTYDQMAEACDISYAAIRSYIHLNSSMNSRNMLKVSMATGIPV